LIGRGRGAQRQTPHSSVHLPAGDSALRRFIGPLCSRALHFAPPSPESWEGLSKKALLMSLDVDSRPAALPGVTLPAGQYLFRLSDPNGYWKVAQVSLPLSGSAHSARLRPAAAAPPLAGIGYSTYSHGVMFCPIECIGSARAGPAPHPQGHAFRPIGAQCGSVPDPGVRHRCRPGQADVLRRG
jgi:hypothetical protein